MEFVPAPEGFWSEGGWWTTLSGATSALEGFGRRTGCGHSLPNGALGVRCAVEFEWTKAMSQARLGDATLVKSVVFPVGLTAIGEKALYQFEAIELVVFPASCIRIGDFAFAGCTALKAISFPVGCKATGEHAFSGCGSLVSVTIPAGCSMISRRCFSRSTSITEVRFPNGLRLIEEQAFHWSALKEVALPDGCEVAKWAFWQCEALTKVMIGSRCRSVGESAF
jgi:hypothetical protein